MKTQTIAKIAAAALAGVALVTMTARAEDSFQDHFMSEWDLNTDGKITLEEITSRRTDVFAAFDANENGILDAEERAMMDEMRENQHGDMNGGKGMAQGNGHGQGNGKGMGKGPGAGKGPMMGKGPGQGHGNGQGSGQGHGKGIQMQAEAGMHSGKAMDTNNDGSVSKDEFIGFSATWLAKMDSNGDSVIDSADF